MKKKEDHSEFYNRLHAGLSCALKEIKDGTAKRHYIDIPEEPLKEYSPKDIKQIRSMLGWTQEVMAIRMGVHKKTVEAWEYGTNKPSGPARRLLELYEKQDLKKEEKETSEAMAG